MSSFPNLNSAQAPALKIINMESYDLPNKNSGDLYLVEATHDEIVAQQHANSDEWKGPLNLEQYLRREEFLSTHELTKDGGLTSWMLVYQPNAEGPRQVLCGCETIKKRALVANDSKVQDHWCDGVCSVFCPPKFRGRGYAGRMITELGKRLDGWQAENGKHPLFSVLFSDIGKQFYAARGWQVFPSSEVSLPVGTASARQIPQNVRYLLNEDLDELCALDEKILRKRLSRSEEGWTVALVPDKRTLSWHHARENFVAKELYGIEPTAKGAIVGEAGQRIWVWWTRVWPNPQEKTSKTLHVLRLAFEDETWSEYAAATPEDVARVNPDVASKIEALFAAAEKEASSWQMKKVSLWNPSSAALAAARRLDSSTTVVHREEESITSLRWFGPGSSKDVKWEANEKYGWC